MSDFLNKNCLDRVVTGLLAFLGSAGYDLSLFPGQDSVCSGRFLALK